MEHLAREFFEPFIITSYLMKNKEKHNVSIHLYIWMRKNKGRFQISQQNVAVIRYTVLSSISCCNPESFEKVETEAEV